MMSFPAQLCEKWGRKCGWLPAGALALGILLTSPWCLAQALFPKGCTVVLLSGLAGDAESENLYRDQLQSWLDLALADSASVQVLAFCDAPDTLQLPSGSKAKIWKNDRQTFLASTEELARGTNNLLFVAWGHGGRQGANNVLHVRGPRLTAADLAPLAARPGQSQWILLFRGSGVFARRIASANAQVVSSDVDQSFSSDPVGMGIMLKLVRGPAAASFETLAKEFGRATAGWYGERRLARTEDPALWMGEDPPQLLAADAGSAAPPEKRDPSKPAESTPGKPSPEASELATKTDAPRPSELPAAWNGVRRVSAAAYPQADAVILRQRLICRLGSDPALTTEQDQFIQVLTPEGKTAGDFDVSFAPPAEEIEFQDCEVLRPDGVLERLEPDRVGEAREQPLGDYQPRRRKFFSLPGVGPGAVIHVRYRTQWKKFPLPQISLGLPIAKEFPALRSTVQVSLPKDSAFHWAFEHLTAPDPAVKTSAYANTYTWEFQDLPPQRREILSPPRAEPRLLISTFQDWAAFADWYARISRLTAEVTPEITAKAKELTAEAKDDREKLLSLYNYVVALRYVAVPLGINSVRPHAAANVLQNQFGDCKDKANLLNAMLRALSIEAYLVLVPRFSQAHDAVPGLSFNHAISHVKLGAESVWLDTTDDVCRFGMLPPGDYGRNVLVIDSEPKALTQLPAADPQHHRLELEGQIRWSSEAESLHVSLCATGFGYPDYELRAASRQAREDHASLPLLATRFNPVAGVFGLEDQSATPVSALDQNFVWKAQGRCLGLVSGGGTDWALHSPFWLPKEWHLALHQRQNPLFLNQGYPVTLAQRFEIQLPVKPRSIALPATCQNSDGPLRWSIGWTRISDVKLEAKLKAELLAGELSIDETSLFQGQLRAFFNALANDVRMNLSPGNGPKPQN